MLVFLATNFYWFCSNRPCLNYWRWMFYQSKGEGSTDKTWTISKLACPVRSVRRSLKKTDALAPFTVLSESRDHLHYDSFGHLLGRVSDCTSRLQWPQSAVWSPQVPRRTPRYVDLSVITQQGKNETLTHMFELTCIADACLFPSLGCKKS